MTSRVAGSVVQADDGRWHMYAAMMADNATLQSWLTKSVVLHAVADLPQGPYTPSDIALAPRPNKFDSQMIHNPDVRACAVHGFRSPSSSNVSYRILPAVC